MRTPSYPYPQGLYVSLVPEADGRYGCNFGAAVTLEGTIIHKSGLITGGRSTHDSGKKWEEKDIQGAFILRRLHRMIFDAYVRLVCLHRLVASEG